MGKAHLVPSRRCEKVLLAQPWRDFRSHNKQEKGRAKQNSSLTTKPCVQQPPPCQTSDVHLQHGCIARNGEQTDRSCPCDHVSNWTPCRARAGQPGGRSELSFS